MSKSKKLLVTHDGSFHTDDIFAAATLSIMLSNKGEDFEIIRSRDLEIIKDADYVFDVGGVYDPEKNKFDHHQVGGAGKRDGIDGEEGIEYASFGLVWKTFGQEVSGSEKAADIIDKKLVAPIDAWDNGFDLVENKYSVSPFYLQHVFASMGPTWREKKTSDEMFLKSVDIAREILSREITQIEDALMAEQIVVSAYKNSEDKRIVVLDEKYPFQFILSTLSEPLFVVYPKLADDSWGVGAVRDDMKSFKNRKDFPASWGGLRDEELQKVTGVDDALFCHKGLFLAVAQSQAGAMKLAQLALPEPKT